MGNAPAGPGRGGYQGGGGGGGGRGRGRGYSQSGYQGQMHYSPGPNFRTPNQPRAGPNMGPQFHGGPGQGRPLAPFPNSPHQASRSPALASAHPVATTPQMNAVPMAPPQMAPQSFGAYGQHMGPQAVRFHHPLPPFPPVAVPYHQPPPRRGPFPPKKRSQGPRVVSSPFPPGYSFPPPASTAAAATAHLPPPNLAPESGQFEEYLTLMKSPYQAYPPAYDPNYAYYNPAAAYGMQGMQYMAPPSPQPRPGMPYNPQTPYMPNQYPAQPPAQAAPLSRTPSQVSNQERPGSSMGQPQVTAGTPVQTHAHTASRSSNSPVPKSQFVIPSAKKSPLVIKDPGSGVVKTFEKGPGSPHRGTPSPVKMATPPAASSATPPPRSNNGSTVSDHQRSDSKASAAKSDEEKKRELRNAVLQKIEQDEAEQRRKTDEEEASKMGTEQAAPAPKTTDEDASKKSATDEESTRTALENVSLDDKTEAKPAAQEEKKEEESKKAAPAPLPADDDDIDFDAIEREMAEIEAKEAAAEKDYYAKKQREKEEKERKEKEEADAYEANMKNAEREAEALEEAREKKREAGETESPNKDLFSSLKKGGFPATETSTPGESGASTPVSDVSMGPPGKPASVAKREKPAALKLETGKAVEPPPPSAAMKALQAARFVVDLSQISYPESVVSPNPALNANAPADRKFHYNKEFLLQFQNVFKEKPSVDWDARVRETVGDPEASSRPQSARTPMTGGGRTSSRPGVPQPFQMGNFGQPNRHSLPPLQNATIRSASNNNPFGNFGRPGMGMPGISRTNSAASMQAGMPGAPPRVASNRAGTRSGSKRDKNAARKDEEMSKTMPLTAGQEVKALQVSSTGWKPRSITQPQAAGPALGASGYMPPDVVQRKVKAALNKMTPENFDRIAGQILEIVSQSKTETDGRTLRQVIQLTFEKATDEAHWASIYAKFCKRMLESMSAEIKDESIRDKTGNIVTGGSLFRKYLLNRCQEEFERGWKVNLPPKPEGDTEEAAMMSDEYYVAAAAKRRGLGLVKFIGELYKLGMLTERIMHECVKRLVDYEGVPDEAEVESLTNLLRTIGASLDASEKGHALMDVYFTRIKMMMDTEGLNSRLQFMLLDVTDLRNSGWASKDADKGPKTIHEIREEAARAHQAAEMERMRQQVNRGGGRAQLGRGDARNFSGGYGQQAPPPDFASSKVGSDDLRRLRTTRSTNQPMSFGPSSMLGSRSNSGRRNLGPGGNLVRGSEDSAASSRTGTPPTGKKDEKDSSSSINAFSALASLEDRDNLATSPPSNPASPMMAKVQPAAAGAAQPTAPKPPAKEGETS